MKKKILLVDDHPMVLLGLRDTLNRNFDICGEATNGREGVRKALKLQPDLVLMDVSMPVMNGFDATREIRARLPQTRVVLFTMFDADEVAFQAKNAGAAAVLTKGISPVEIRKAIEQILAGERAPGAVEPCNFAI